jgi:hypothetical protein
MVITLSVCMFSFVGTMPGQSITTGVTWIKNIVSKLDIGDYVLTNTPDGNLAITGCFADKVSFGSKSLVAVGGYDIFVAKYAQDGTLLWLQQAGGSDFDMANMIKVDTIGNIFVTGYVTGIAFFGDYIVKTKGKRNIFNAKYSKDGKLMWIQAEGCEVIYEMNPVKRKKILAKLAM